MLENAVGIFKEIGLGQGDRLANFMLAGDLYGSFVSFDHITTGWALPLLPLLEAQSLTPCLTFGKNLNSTPSKEFQQLFYSFCGKLKKRSLHLK